MTASNASNWSHSGSDGYRWCSVILRVVVAVLCTMVTLNAQPADIQSSPVATAPMPLAKCGSDIARGYFDLGLELASKREYQDAVSAFEDAYACSPHHVVLHNIAQVYVEMGEPGRAAEYLARYLEEGQGEISEPQAREAREQLNQLRGAKSHRVIKEDTGPPLANLGRKQPVAPDVSTKLSIHCDVPHTILLVDGEPAARHPFDKPLGVPGGQHDFQFVKYGFASKSLRHEVQTGRATVLDCKLEPKLVPGVEFGKIVVRGKTSAARVTLNGHTWRGGAVPVGTHRLTIAQRGEPATSRLILVKPGETTVVGLSSSLPPSVQPTEGNWRLNPSTGELVLGTVGIAALASGISLTIWNSSRFDDWEREDRALQSESRVVNTEEQAAALNARQAANNELNNSIKGVLAVQYGLQIGGALAVASAVYLALEHEPHSSSRLAWNGNGVLLTHNW